MVEYSNEKSDEETEQNRSTINRRKLIGAVGTGLTLGPSFIQTATATPTSSKISNTLDKDSVKQVLDYVDIDPNKDSVQDQSTTKIGKSEKTQLESIKIEYQTGTLEHIKVLSSVTDRLDEGESRTSFSIPELTDSKKQELSDKFNSTPTGVTVKVKYRKKGDDNILVDTTTTRSEEEQLKKITDLEELSAVYTGSGTGSYIVTDTEGTTYRISGEVDRPEIRQATVEPIVQPNVYDSSYCYQCGSSQGTCPQCVVSCNPVSGDILSCVSCIATNCADVDVGACAKCIAWAASVGIV
ncbi:hypothetical protein ACFSBX_16950 [Halobellus rarus]|uniref:Twin-arginine translocation signal domain-containing protein n=1 Tax=Halobellus rarus TaxID=1126237 RepID=A0ABD6CR07_9EURY